MTLPGINILQNKKNPVFKICSLSEISKIPLVAFSPEQAFIITRDPGSFNDGCFIDRSLGEYFFDLVCCYI